MGVVVTLKLNKNKKLPIFLIIGFSVIILGATVFMMLRNTRELRVILENSIKAQLISTSVAARGVIDVDRFYAYNSIEDIENDIEAFERTLEELRLLKTMFDVTYIYALKIIDGVYYFIFDTDLEDDAIFDMYFDADEEYDVPDVFREAFLGRESAGIMNLVDEWGSFNTGAVPIFREGTVIGIVCTDIEDTYIQNSDVASFRNAIALIITLSATIAAMIIVISLMSRNIQAMQDKLFKMANYDILTELPNRQYLMSYLSEYTTGSNKDQSKFALLLIDLDNFKLVNDNAGHDAGDELLRDIAKYLDNIHENSKSFRPPAGFLNVSARIGGDEFVQIIHGIDTEDEAEKAANKLLMNFNSQTRHRCIEKYQVGLSVGIALFPYHTKNFNVLIKYADIAMYYAKKSGKNNCRIYSDEMSQMDLMDERPESGKTFPDRRRYRR